MTDRVKAEIRSRNMAAVKSKNTLPEKAVRSKVFRNGFRYRLHVKSLKGSPDIVFLKYCVAVFIHGCFWHGHDCPKGKRPQTHRKFWNKKINGNIERDKKVSVLLEKEGWKVLTIWACQLEKGTEKLLTLLKNRRKAMDGKSSKTK